MDRINILGILAPLAILASACTDSHPQAKRLQQLDSLQQVAHQYQSRLDTIDIGQVRSLARHVDSQYNFVLKHYPDAEDRDFWLKEVNYFGEVNKSLNRLAEAYPSLEKEAAYNLRQLKTLQNSIRDRKVSGEEAQKYWEREQEAMQSLGFKMGKNLAGAERALNLWDSLGTSYDSIANYWREKTR